MRVSRVTYLSFVSKRTTVAIYLPYLRQPGGVSRSMAVHQLPPAGNVVGSRYDVQPTRQPPPTERRLSADLWQTRVKMWAKLRFISVLTTLPEAYRLTSQPGRPGRSQSSRWRWRWIRWTRICSFIRIIYHYMFMFVSAYVFLCVPVCSHLPERKISKHFGLFVSSVTFERSKCSRCARYNPITTLLNGRTPQNTYHTPSIINSQMVLRGKTEPQQRHD